METNQELLIETLLYVALIVGGMMWILRSVERNKREKYSVGKDLFNLVGFMFSHPPQPVPTFIVPTLLVLFGLFGLLTLL